MTNATVVAATCLVLVAGCNLGGDGTGKDQPTSTTQPGSAELPGKGGTLPAPGQGQPPASQPAGGSAGGVPDIPDSRSNPPTLGEWASAAEVNTVGANSAPKNCYMKLVREWLKVNCTGNIENVSDMEGFGKDGFDFFQVVKPGTLADLVVRVRKGNALKARINRGDHRASLFVNWPQAAAKPTIVALQHNPK